jgi:DNA-binding transcriptional ArsR family regulator
MDAPAALALSLDAQLDGSLDAVFGALADPTRRAILVRLTQGEATVSDLVRPFTISQPAISRHLKVLEHAGLISRSRRATARLSKLEPEPLRDALTWLASYREFWEESFERLDDLLDALQREDQHDRSEPDEGRSTT